MKRLGIIDFDTSHASAFVSRVNHVGVAEDQWVEGAKFVVGCPGKSVIFPERIPKETKKVKELGLPLVDSPEEMLKHNLDAVFIESNSGLQHLERARFFLEHKLPLFIDKPFACSAADAKEMFALADKFGVPIMSASSLRYADEVDAFRKSKAAGDKSLGCIAFGPAPTHEMNPGLFHYGIHAVEILFSVMGAGCESVTCNSSELAEVATGTWKDGRLGTVRGSRPSGGYGFCTFVVGNLTSHSINTGYIYRNLLRAILEMLNTGKSPIPPQESLEIVQFIEQSIDSAANHGNPRRLA